MKRPWLLFCACALSLLAGCAAAPSRPVTASEPDPWAGYKGTFDKPLPSDAPKEESKSDAVAKADPAKSDDADDTSPQPKKKKKAKKGHGAAPANAVAGKKPRRRAKRHG